MSGYFGGRVDNALMRVIDVLMTIPSVMLALAVAAALGPGLWNIILAVALSTVPNYARIMRGKFSASRTARSSCIAFDRRCRIPGIHPARSAQFVVSAIGHGRHRRRHLHSDRFGPKLPGSRRVEGNTRLGLTAVARKRVSDGCMVDLHVSRIGDYAVRFVR